MSNKRLASTLIVWLLASFAHALEFHITFAPSVSKQSFTGRVFVMLTKNQKREPRAGINWYQPEPIFAKDVKDWRAGESVILDHRVLAYPTRFRNLKKGEWTIQAVMDFDQGYRRFSNAPGNGYSKTTRVELDPDSETVIKLHIDQVVKAPAFKETDRIKLVDIPSRLLSEFHGKPMRMQAGVLLPKSYHQETNRRYPIIYDIPGFGGTHHGAMRAAKRNPTDVARVDFIYVILNPECRWGHHVFADSENNGPCGKALITELIPHIENTYRAIGKASARFVRGHSSGGWSSLWLQVTYPDFFGGVWSTSPDSIDFRAFQAVDIYQASNIFRDEKDMPRPLIRRGTKVVKHVKPFSDMEQIMGHGGQLGSFEAVFSPRGKDGRPAKLWQRSDGRINHGIAKTWKRYDIGLILKENWSRLRPKLQGKLHIYMGGQDNFYLDGAVRLLQQSMTSLNSDAKIEIFPGRSHSILDSKLRKRIQKEMAEQFRNNNGN